MNRIQRIAFVSDAVMPYNIGGKERRLYEISKRLVRDDREVHIYTMKWWNGHEKTVWHEGVCFHAISRFYPLYVNNRRSMKEAIMFGLATFRLIFVKFDVLDVDHMPFFPLFSARIVTWLKGKKMYATWHEVWGKEYWKKYLGKLGFIAYLIEEISIVLPDTIVSVSNHTTNNLHKVLKTKKKIITIQNGIDLKMIQGATPSPLASDIVFAGRLLSHKNVDVLLRAISIFKKNKPEIKLFIVGDGPERKNLEKLSQNLHLEENVSFPGFFKENDELYKVMKSSKVFILPSTREGFGITVIEANACGLPVIAIDHEHNAVKDLIINGENGKLCVLDKNQLADTIEKVLNARKEREFYIKYAEQYDWSNIISKVENIYGL